MNMNRNKRRTRSNRRDRNNKSTTTIQPLPYVQYNQFLTAETAVNGEQYFIGNCEMHYFSEQQQKEMIGEELYYYVYQLYPERAGKLTGMLLEMDVQSLLQMLGDGNFMRDMNCIRLVAICVGWKRMMAIAYTGSRWKGLGVKAASLQVDKALKALMDHYAQQKNGKNQ